MTVTVHSKPLNLERCGDIELADRERDLYRYHCSVTERMHDHGNDFVFREGDSWRDNRPSMYIVNPSFQVAVTHTSLENLIREMFWHTDILAKSVERLTSLGFEVKAPDIKSPEGESLKRYIKCLPHGASEAWKDLYYYKLKQKEETTQ